MEEKKKIYALIHGGGDVNFHVYVNHMAALIEAHSQYSIGLFTLGGMKVAQSRNTLFDKIKEAKEQPDYIFSLDCDHIVPINIIELLMQSMDQGYSAASGLVHRRLGDLEAIGYTANEDGTFNKLSLPPSGDIYDVHMCAFGCTLFNYKDLLEINETLDPLFQDTTFVTNSGDVTNRRSDINLFLALHNAGKKLAIDSRVCVGHQLQPNFVFPQNASTLQNLRDTEQLAHPAGYPGLPKIF